MTSNVARFPTRRYTTVAITLHWVIAAAIVCQIASGLWMSSAITDPGTKAFAYRVFQWHKAAGLIVLALSFVRLGWRLGHPPPPLPGHMTALERMAASVTHLAFYGLMIAMPLAGWAMVSASPIGVPTMIFGLFEWPHLPVLSTLADKAPVELAFKTAHRVGAYIFVALLLLHIGAALKHHFRDRDDVLTRMLPGPSAPPNRPVGMNGAHRAPSAVPHSAAPRRAGSPASVRRLPAWVPFAALFVLAAVASVIWPPALPRSSQTPAETPPQAAITERAPAGTPSRWIVEPVRSRIAFQGTHSGTAFRGTFERWSADIMFDPADLPRSKARVEIDLTSARTGDSTYDTTLPGADWFDVAKSATAIFETVSIASAGGTSYVADGRLTIRTVTVPVRLALDIVIEGRTARMTGRAAVRRLDFGIGKGSDSSGAWVALEIPIELTVVATRG